MRPLHRAVETFFGSASDPKRTSNLYSTIFDLASFGNLATTWHCGSTTSAMTAQLLVAIKMNVDCADHIRPN